jgi:hypothetical protein
VNTGLSLNSCCWNSGDLHSSNLPTVNEPYRIGHVTAGRSSMCQ